MAPFNKRLPPLPGLQAIETGLSSPEIPTTPSGRVTNPTNRLTIREGQTGTSGSPWSPSVPWAVQGSADYNLQSLFSNLNGISAQSLGNQRTGSGGSGGGSMDFEGNMDANPLIGLNPYLEENVTSFSHGGSMGHTGKYRAVSKHTGQPMRQNPLMPGVMAGPNELASYWEKMRELYGDDYGKKYSHGGSMSDSGNKRPGRGVLPPSFRKVYENLGLSEDAMNRLLGPEPVISNRSPFNSWGGSFGPYSPKYHNGGEHIINKIYPSHKPKYAGGGMYEQQANQSIQASNQANEQQALGQLSGLLAKTLQNKMSPEQATTMASQMANQSGLLNQPMANQGMRIPRYNEGGMTVQEANASGKKYVINQDGSAQILDFQGVGPGREISRVAMDPALLGGGTKTPSDPLLWDRQVMSRMSPPKNIYKETRRLEDQYAPLASPMANQGMRMRKRYTQGGRF